MNYLRLLRIGHWVKNLFLLAPPFFGGTLFHWEYSGRLGLAFLAFGLVASGVYVFNDWKDIEADRAHPEKRNRPLAAGTVPEKHAFLLMALCWLGGALVGLSLGQHFFWMLALYFLLNIGYTLGLKHVSILDVLIVSVGFVLRVEAGGIVTDVRISNWLNVMVFLLALFLAFAKRRDDVLLQLSSGQAVRKASAAYNLDFLNACLTMISSITIVAYLMYTMSQQTTERLGTDQLYLTTVFVMAGVLRYLQLTFVQNQSGSPVAVLYSDRFIQISILLWILSFFMVIY